MRPELLESWHCRLTCRSAPLKAAANTILKYSFNTAGEGHRTRAVLWNSAVWRKVPEPARGRRRSAQESSQGRSTRRHSVRGERCSLNCQPPGHWHTRNRWPGSVADHANSFVCLSKKVRSWAASSHVCTQGSLVCRRSRPPASYRQAVSASL